MTKKKPPAPPPFNGLVKLSADGWDGIPDGDSPFYIGAEDGLFLHRRSLLGRGVARVQFWPANFPKMGTQTGMFWWQTEPIPARIMGQVVSFFERIYDYQHTEAAVLLAMHQETKEWRVFVPTQMVSHGGVNYVFDHTHIKLPWVLVGTIHSHCDFGAGHSSTDTKDAESFDGFHATIGMIKREVPQIVAMVSMNKRLIHYKEEQFPLLFDFSECKQHEAPKWWDRYVEDTKTKTKPVGFELYEKFKKTTNVGNEFAPTKITPIGDHREIPYRSNYGPNHQYQPQNQPVERDWTWNNQLKRLVHKTWTIEPDGTIKFPGQNGTIIKAIPNQHPPQQPLGYNPEDWDEFYRLQGLEGPPPGYEGISPRLLLEKGYRWEASARTWKWVGNNEPEGLSNESKEFNARRAAEHGASWNKDGELQNDFTQEELREMGLWGLSNDDHWEEKLPKEVLDLLFDSNLMTDEDIDFALRNPETAGDPEYWQEAFLSKTLSSIRVLRAMGLSVTLRIGSTPEPPEDIEVALLPETATPAEAMKGVH